MLPVNNFSSPVRFGAQSRSQASRPVRHPQPEFGAFRPTRRQVGTGVAALLLTLLASACGSAVPAGQAAQLEPPPPPSSNTQADADAALARCDYEAGLMAHSRAKKGETKPAPMNCDVAVQGQPGFNSSGSYDHNSSTFQRLVDPLHPDQHEMPSEVSGG